ncbi:hypothetical protein ACRALDRAFT_2019082 [Sodiomyces alcalophilus JCM 7366]|uniref:uncharacterized protein n=1 Tax=Sodiomyces alcalophilus JCM 7366 TaxID=591952 RepID=UPI0039B56F89
MGAKTQPNQSPGPLNSPHRPPSLIPSHPLSHAHSRSSARKRLSQHNARFQRNKTDPAALAAALW